jgi:hypothetical protein
LIQFACPSCRSTCSVGDQFAGRKIKCPKCGARVVHVHDSKVELLTAGKAPAPAAAPSAVPPAGSPLSDATPLATAVMPQSVGEFVQQSESKQNVLVVSGLIGLFTVILSILGIAFDLPLLAVAPIGIALTITAVWLWVRMKRRAANRKPAA